VLDRISKEIVTPEPAAFTVSPAIMTYDFDDRLATWNSNACVSDLDGNLTSGPIAGAMATMTYNARNQLTATSGSNASTYIYDAEGRRLSRTTGGVTTTFVTDPNAPLSQLLTSTTSGVTTRYVYAAGILLYQDVAGAIKVHHAGPRGSVTAISDGTATVTDRISYGTYGEIVARTGTTNTPFLYNGLYGVQTDPNALLYMRARYYNTNTRRFLNADPIGFAGGNNWFGYVSGDPINGMDPLGLAQTYATDSHGFHVHSTVKTNLPAGQKQLTYTVVFQTNGSWDLVPKPGHLKQFDKKKALADFVERINNSKEKERMRQAHANYFEMASDQQKMRQIGKFLRRAIGVAVLLGTISNSYALEAAMDAYASHPNEITAWQLTNAMFDTFGANDLGTANRSVLFQFLIDHADSIDSGCQ
jgi:RHS repeat-associated protein